MFLHPATASNISPECVSTTKMLLSCTWYCRKKFQFQPSYVQFHTLRMQNTLLTYYAKLLFNLLKNLIVN